MTRSLTVTVNAARMNVAKSIKAAARAAPLLLLTSRALDELTDELGSYDAAMHHLLRVSETVNKPIGVNFETPDGSRTCFLAPKSWSQERLRGWVGAKHTEIADAFGPATPVPMEDL